MAKAKEIAVVEANPFAVAEVPDYIKKGEARGSEEVGSKDIVLPRLEIVQAQSPIKEENEDAREGHLFNSVTKELYGDLVYFVPVYYRMEYLVWKDADAGGGFFGSYPSEADANERRRQVLVDEGLEPELIEVVDTPVHYGYRITPEGVCEQIVISMAKSKSKVSRKWNAMIQINGGDRFSRVYKLTTFTDENKQGKKFKNFVVQPAGFCPKPVYLQAEALYEVLKTQAVKVAHDTVFENEAEQPAEGTTSDRGGI